MSALPKPNGLWPSPISPHDVSQGIRFSDLSWAEGPETLIWLEQRSDRGVLVSWSPGEVTSRDLTSDLAVRAAVGYGGGDFTVQGRHIYFVSSGRLHRQGIDAGIAQAITPEWGQAASPSVSPDGAWVAYVHSHQDVDVVAVTDSRGIEWPVKLAAGHDFYMQPTWHPDGRRMAWVAWDNPHMPWDSSALYLSHVDDSGRMPFVIRSEVVAGDLQSGVAVSQPVFSPDGRYLSFLSDQNGWVNPWLFDLETGESFNLWEEKADFAGPAWVQGMHTTAWSADARWLCVVRQSNGFSTLFRIRRDRQERIEETAEYTAISQIACSSQGKIAFVGSASHLPARIVCVLPDSDSPSVLRRSRAENLPEAFCSNPRALKFEVESEVADRPGFSHGLFYPPTNPDFESSVPPPALICIHGGPTSMSIAQYDAEIQFFTSRGWAVLDLNYRGSAGFGRDYAQSLRGQWGVLDVEDVAAAADYLSHQALADSERIVLSGGSAGGLTVLLGLIRHPGRFRAGICRYGVTNLFELAAETHKFEAHYLDSLLGPLPQAREVYRQRSPLYAAQEIREPLAIYQGEEDQVVPRAQSDALVSVLKAQGVPHLYEVFPGEGHGFRRNETIQSYLESVDAFLRRHVVFGGDG